MTAQSRFLANGVVFGGKVNITQQVVESTSPLELAGGATLRLSLLESSNGYSPVEFLEK
jgi:hypothetical protein